jgi:hypothetical protein
LRCLEQILTLVRLVKRTFLRQFRPFLAGTPSHDHLGDIFATLDAEQFQRCFVAWVSSLTGVVTEVIAIDTKTSRRSVHKAGNKAAIHMVSAFAARQRLVLGQVKVDETSNEITAIPRLLAMMEIEGAIVTIDAMGCRDDEYRVRTKHAPANFTTIKHMAQNLLRRAPGKDSMRLKRKVAAWDDQFLAEVISR